MVVWDFSRGFWNRLHVAEFCRFDLGWPVTQKPHAGVHNIPEHISIPSVTLGVPQAQ
jgi:hypothetical protein